MRELAAKLVRYGVVGAASGLVYAVVTYALVLVGVDPVVASVAGYCAAVPLSFVGHRQFTFRAIGRWSEEAVRFAIAQAINIAVAAGSMRAAVDFFGDWRLGVVAAVLLVPIANFVFTNLWVFQRQHGRQRVE